MLRILLVEDNQQDRQILRYLLNAQFKNEAELFESQTLFQATKILETVPMDCVVLDLQLPDSVGKETFEYIYTRFPDVPVIVLTHNRDQRLALDMIRSGAADYVIKNYADEEDIFRRIVFAIEKHRRTVRVTPDDAQSYHRLGRVTSNLEKARQTEESSGVIRDISFEVAAATADLSRRMFTELQQINTKLAQYAAQQDAVVKTVTSLDLELLRGYADRPSAKSRLDLLDHRVKATENGIKEIRGNVNEVEDTQRKEALQVVQTKMTNHTKIIIAILALIGATSTALATYYGTIHKIPDINPKVAP